MALTILTIFSILFNKIGALNQMSWLYINFKGSYHEIQK